MRPYGAVVERQAANLAIRYILFAVYHDFSHEYRSTFRVPCSLTNDHPCAKRLQAAEATQTCMAVYRGHTLWLFLTLLLFVLEPERFILEIALRPTLYTIPASQEKRSPP